MTADPFSDALLKVERAKHHITDLNRQINAFLAQRPFRLMVRQYPYLSELHAVVDTHKSIPTDISLVLGDAVHNLRSALDIMMFSLIGDRVSRPDKLYFPFPKSAEAFESAITGAHVQIAGKRIVTAIKSLEPYPDGKYRLYTLHELDVRDKHRLLLPAWRNSEISQAQLKEIHPLFDFGRSPDLTFNFLMDPDKPVLAAVQFQPVGDRADLVPFHEEEAKVQPTFTIAFDKGHALASQPLVETMTAMTTATEIAINTVKLAYLEGVEAGDLWG